MSSHVDLGAPCPFLVRGEDGVEESTPMLEDTSENAGRMPLYMQWGYVCMVLGLEGGWLRCRVGAEVKFRKWSPEGVGGGHSTKLRRSRDLSCSPTSGRHGALGRQGPEKVVVPVGVVLGQQVHPCPHLASGGKKAVP